MLALNPMVVNYNSSPESEELNHYVYSKQPIIKDLHIQLPGALDLKERQPEFCGSLATPHQLCRSSPSLE
jgi:hypothetical protein